MDAGIRRFVTELAAENEAFWAGRDVRVDADAPPEVRLAQIRYRMRQGVYNELRATELIAAWLPTIPEREIRDLLAQQLDDEQRHYQLLRRRVLALGEDPGAYQPPPEWRDLFDWLIACRDRPTLQRLAMFQFAGETQSCEGFETLIRLARDVDPESAELYRTARVPGDEPEGLRRLPGAPGSGRPRLDPRHAGLTTSGGGPNVATP